MVHTYAATAASGMPAAPSARPIVSFVVPCYNSAAYMRTCIDSLVPALDCCEAIIVNDGSTDATEATVASLAGESGARIVYRRQANAGVAAARNVFQGRRLG